MPYNPGQNFSFGNYGGNYGGGGGWNPMEGGGGFNPYGGGGYGGGMSMGYPGQQQGGGGGLGGTLGSIFGTIGGGMMGTNPVGLGIMAGGQLLSGLLGGIAAGNKQKKKEKAFKAQQQMYQKEAARLFPEMDRESFQYKNPALNNAIQGALAYRMSNMFGNWGMPTDMRQGSGNLNDLFAALMPQAQQTPPMQPGPGQGGGGYGGGGYGGGGPMGGGGRGGRRGWAANIPAFAA
jgi:hypothetical protein